MRSTTESLYIPHERYATHILNQFEMKNANESSRPMIQNLDLEQRSNPCNMLYREAIGSLLYLSVRTRRDISYAVARLAKMSRIQNCFIGTVSNESFAILLKRKNWFWSIHNGQLVLAVYVDAD